MKSIEVVIKEYETAILEFEKKSIISDYLSLKGITLNYKQRKLFNNIKTSFTVKKYEDMKYFLDMLKNPVKSDLKDRIDYIIELGLDIDSIEKMSPNYVFADGLSIARWFQSLYDKYVNCTYYDEYTISEFKRLYTFLVRNKNEFVRRLRELQISLMIDDDAMTAILNIKPYLFNRILFSLDNMDNIIKERLVYNLRKYFSQYKLDLEQQFFLDNLVNYLEKLEIKEKKLSNNDRKNRKNSTAFLSKNVLVERFDELKKLAISNTGLLLDGNYDETYDFDVKTWWNKILEYNASCKEGVHSDYICQSINEIKELLCSAEKYVLNENSKYNYGAQLDKLSISYAFSNKDFFYLSGIPSSIMEKLRNNTLYPDKKLVRMILDFLDKLESIDKYQEQDRLSTIDIFNCVLKELDSKKDYKYDFVVYGEDKLSEYESSFDDVDSEVMALVKERNRDWYIKCLTYYYILKKEYIDTHFNGYFYDGSLIRKWLHTQERIISGTNTTSCPLTKEQLIMFKVIVNKKNSLKNSSTMQENFIANIDYYCDALINVIKTDKKISRSKYIGSYRVSSLWQVLNSLLNNNSSKLSSSQIKRLKEVKLEQLRIGRDEIDSRIVGTDFGFELLKFVYSVGFTLTGFADYVGCSRSKLAAYSSNIVKPIPKSIKEIREAVLKLDRSRYRDDQVEDIEHFLNVLDKVLVERKNIQKVIKANSVIDNGKFSGLKVGCTGNIWDDLDNDVLNRVKSSDNKWFDEFVEVAEYIANNVCRSYKRTKNWQLNWYIDMIGKTIHNDLNFEQEYLLYYLESLNKWYKIKDEYKLFISKLEALEDFIYKNNREPDLNELKFSDRTDAYIFYKLIYDCYFGFSNIYLYIDDIARERIKSIVQYVRISGRDYGDCGDYISDNHMYIGMHLDFLRISLGLSLKKFDDIFGISMANYLANKNYLTEDIIIKLINYLENIDWNNFREDQFKDANYMLEILKSRKLYTFDVSLLQLIKRD